MKQRTNEILQRQYNEFVTKYGKEKMNTIFKNGLKEFKEKRMSGNYSLYSINELLNNL